MRVTCGFSAHPTIGSRFAKNRDDGTGQNHGVLQSLEQKRITVAWEKLEHGIRLHASATWAEPVCVIPRVLKLDCSLNASPFW